jgi:aminoglycoside/choline kinase family phosphotransferase
MKPEQAEQFLIEELFNQTQDRGFCKNEKLQTVDRLTGDASTRRYYRLFTENTSYVACLDNPLSDPNAKNPFVANQEFLLASGIRVPKIVDKNLTKGYILEEDLGDTTLLVHLAQLKSPKQELEIYKKIIDQLIQLHSIPQTELTRSDLYHLKFDITKLMDEMEFTFKFFLRIFLKIKEEDEISTF